MTHKYKLLKPGTNQEADLTKEHTDNLTQDLSVLNAELDHLANTCAQHLSSQATDPGFNAETYPSKIIRRYLATAMNRALRTPPAAPQNIAQGRAEALEKSVYHHSEFNDNGDEVKRVYWIAPTDFETIRAALSTPAVPAEVIEQVAEALETPERMADADMMFGLSDFDHIKYETVRAIAQAALRISGKRNQAALSALSPYRKPKEQ